MSGQTWLRTDEIEEFIDALEHAALFAKQLTEDVKAWKWLIIALHSALQGACVCALRGHDTTEVAVLTRKSRREVLRWLQVDTRKNPCLPGPEPRLAPLIELFDRVQKPRYLLGSHTLDVSVDMVADVKELNRLRNDFIHFLPGGMSSEVSPRIVTHAADAIKHLAVEHPTFGYKLVQSDRDRIKEALVNLRVQVTERA